MRVRTVLVVLGLLVSSRDAATQVPPTGEAALWPPIPSRLLSHARLDSTRVFPITTPAPGSTVYADAVGFQFKPGVSLPTKRAVLDRQQLTVVGVSPDSVFFARFPAPGSLQQLSDKVDAMRREIEVASASMVHHRVVLGEVRIDHRDEVRLQLSPLPLASPPPRIVPLPRRKVLHH